MILSIKTDSPVAELALLQPNGRQIARDSWHADRALAKDLHTYIKTLLEEHKKGWEDLSGIIVFRGPGSFTGLRIGITVANALAYGLSIPVVGTLGDTWQADAMARLEKAENDRVVLPHYGSEPHITKPKK